jgi:large subunit ribosomal protein L6
MSRIGKKPIEIPKAVSIFIGDEIISVTGKYGILEKKILNSVNLKLLEDKLFISRTIETKKAREYHGLIRALIQNMVLGVSQKFSKSLIAEGVGYKFQLEKEVLIANVGYTHSISFNIPQDLEIKLESPTKIIISGMDKEKVGFMAANIRNIRPPEPYKGKGILYQGEIIRRKVGKTGK